MSPTTISRFVPPGVRILAVSPGGTGTTMLMEFLEARVRCNDSRDRDALKHFPGPLLPLNRKCRVIYLYGDPVATCISLFRRGYAPNQSSKLNRRLAGFEPPIRPGESLEEYARHGSDRLGLAAQFHHWFDTPRPYDVAFVRYETMWETLPQLLAFLRLDPALAREFPPRQERHKTDHVSAETRQQLEAIYGRLGREMDQLGGLYVSPGAPGFRRTLTWLSLARRAILPTLSWELSCRWPGLHRFLRWCGRHAALS